MVDPKILCTKHLLGEHCEHHMFLGALKKKIKINGYINNNLIEPTSLYSRHMELVDEMVSRGMVHKSDINFDEVASCINWLPINHLTYKIDRQIALEDLLNRCETCRNNYKLLINNRIII